MIVADFENLEMHLLHLIAELLCTALSGTFGPFVLPHFGLFDVMRSSDNMLYEDHGHGGAEGKLRTQTRTLI